MVMRHFVLGGARSGKTKVALSLAMQWAQRDQLDVTYVATAEALDDEMRVRIARHRAERPQHWKTLEAPLQLASTLSRIPPPAVIVIDCMTLWLTNAMLRDFDDAHPRASFMTWDREREDFFRLLNEYSGVIVMVSNEVGSGVVPASALSRRFQDEQGWLNQRLAQLCDRVTLVVAGIEMPLKGFSAR